MRDSSEHYCNIMKSFKVAQLDTLLLAKGKAGTGQKADKARDVAWLYTEAEIREHKKNQRMAGLPAIMTQGREPGQTSLDDFFPSGA